MGGVFGSQKNTDLVDIRELEKQQEIYLKLWREFRDIIITILDVSCDFDEQEYQINTEIIRERNLLESHIVLTPSGPTVIKFEFDALKAKITLLYTNAIKSNFNKFCSEWLPIAFDSIKSEFEARKQAHLLWVGDAESKSEAANIEFRIDPSLSPSDKEILVGRFKQYIQIASNKIAQCKQDSSLDSLDVQNFLQENYTGFTYYGVAVKYLEELKNKKQIYDVAKSQVTEFCDNIFEVENKLSRDFCSRLYDSFIDKRRSIKEEYAVEISERFDKINNLLAVIFQAIGEEEIGRHISVKNIFSKAAKKVNVEKAAKLLQSLDEFKKDYFSNLERARVAADDNRNWSINLAEISTQNILAKINTKLAALTKLNKTIIDQQDRVIINLDRFYSNCTEFREEAFLDYMKENPIEPIDLDFAVKTETELLVEEENNRILSMARVGVATTIAVIAVGAALGPLAAIAAGMVGAFKLAYTTGELEPVKEDYFPGQDGLPILRDGSDTQEKKKELTPEDLGCQTRYEMDVLLEQIKENRQKIKGQYDEENATAAREAISSGIGGVAGGVSSFIITIPLAIILGGTVSRLTNFALWFIPDSYLSRLGGFILSSRSQISQLISGSNSEVRAKRKELGIPFTPEDSMARRNMQDESLGFMSRFVAAIVGIGFAASAIIGGGSMLPAFIYPITTYFVSNSIGRAWSFSTTAADDLASHGPGANFVNNVALIAAESRGVYSNIALVLGAYFLPNSTAKKWLGGAAAFDIAASLLNIITLFKMEVPIEYRLKNIKGMRVQDRARLAAFYTGFVWAIAAGAIYTSLLVTGHADLINIGNTASITGWLINGAIVTAVGLTFAGFYTANKQILNIARFIDNCLSSAIHRVELSVCKKIKKTAAATVNKEYVRVEWAKHTNDPIFLAEAKKAAADGHASFLTNYLPPEIIAIKIAAKIAKQKRDRVAGKEVAGGTVDDRSSDLSEPTIKRQNSGDTLDDEIEDEKVLSTPAVGGPSMDGGDVLSPRTSPSKSFRSFGRKNPFDVRSAYGNFDHGEVETKGAGPQIDVIEGDERSTPFYSLSLGDSSSFHSLSPEFEITEQETKGEVFESDTKDDVPESKTEGSGSLSRLGRARPRRIVSAVPTGEGNGSAEALPTPPQIEVHVVNPDVPEQPLPFADRLRRAGANVFGWTQHVGQSRLQRNEERSVTMA